MLKCGCQVTLPADNALEDSRGLTVIHGDWVIHMGSQKMQLSVSPVVPMHYNVKTVKTSQWLSQI